GLHFYNVRPTVRQHHRASGSRGDLGEIDYAYSLQRGLHRSTFYYWNLICVASRMVFQRAASSLNVLVTCSGVPYWGTNPWAANSGLMDSLLMTVFKAVFSLSTTAWGVPAGARIV